MLLCFMTRYWGTVPVLGFPREPRGHAPTIQNFERQRTSVTCLPQTTWRGNILALHLNYVAGYTSPLLSLVERTHHYLFHNQGLLPWRLRVRCLVRSASSVSWFVLLCFIKLILGNLHDVCMLLCCGPSFWSQVFSFFLVSSRSVCMLLCFCVFVSLFY